MESNLEIPTDIMQLEEDVSSKERNILHAPQNLTTVNTLVHDEECSSSSLLCGFEECHFSNIDESELPNDATRALFPSAMHDNVTVPNDIIDPLTEKSGKSRKRSWNPSKWKSSAAKRAKNSGDTGVSLKGKQLQRKVMGSGCEKSCRFECHAKINEEQRQTLFNDFWGLADHTRQWDYIARLIVFENREEEEEGDSTRKKRSKIQYKLPVDQDVIKVCRSMFTGTLGNIQASAR